MLASWSLVPDCSGAQNLLELRRWILALPGGGGEGGGGEGGERGGGGGGGGEGEGDLKQNDLRREFLKIQNDTTYKGKRGKKGEGEV